MSNEIPCLYGGWFCVTYFTENALGAGFTRKLLVQSSGVGSAYDAAFNLLKEQLQPEGDNWPQPFRITGVEATEYEVIAEEKPPEPKGPGGGVLTICTCDPNRKDRRKLLNAIGKPLAGHYRCCPICQNACPEDLPENPFDRPTLRGKGNIGVLITEKPPTAASEEDAQP